MRCGHPRGRRRRPASRWAIALAATVAAGPASRPTSQPFVVISHHDPVVPPPLPVTRPATAPAVRPPPSPAPPPATAPAGAAPLQVPDPVAYAAGYAAGRRVRDRLGAEGLSFDQLTVVQGVIDALAEKDSKYAAADTRAAIEQVTAAVLQRRAERLAAADPEFRRVAEESAARTATVLAENGRRVGVRIQPDGVQVQAVHDGTGRPVGAAKVAVVRLTVELADGTVVAGGGDAQARLTLADVLPALAGTVRTMRVGDRWRVTLPPDKAYGLAGSPPVIGPNQAVSYDVDVVEVP